MKVLYFAWVRETVGRGEEDIALPPGVGTVAQLVRWLASRGGGYQKAFADPGRLRAAVNHAHAKPDHPVTERDEIAFFPPVTGGRDAGAGQARP